MLKKILWTIIGLIIVLGVVYALGPRVNYTPLQLKKAQVDIDIQDLDQYIKNKEANVPQLKPGNEAKLIWFDSVGQKTPFSVVYLHGFGASHEEGSPMHMDFAKRYGMNLYLSRLYDHGRLDSNTFKNLTPQALYDSTEEAIAIGKKIGDQVIVMSCSTGSTLAILANKTNPDIAAHIMYSPNIDVYDPSAALITMPWGQQIMDAVMGGKYNRIIYEDKAKPYWNETYHTDGIVCLMNLIDHNMTTENFASIDQPLFLGCYYKNEEEQDKVVSVAAMEKFYYHTNTASNQKRMIKFDKAGRHVICSHVFTEDYKSVAEESFKFAEEILNLKPVEQ